MRIMAVDYGDVRTGIAVSDASLSLVGDAWVIRGKNIRDTAQAIVNEATLRDVSRIVVGYPRNMNGSIGPRAEKSERLAALLCSLCDIESELWDERLTTANAHRILGETGRYGKKRKNTIDAVAASLILENYLAFLQRSKTNTKP